MIMALVCCWGSGINAFSRFFIFKIKIFLAHHWAFKGSWEVSAPRLSLGMPSASGSMIYE
jgi:hypothetical protein